MSKKRVLKPKTPAIPSIADQIAAAADKAFGPPVQSVTGDTVDRLNDLLDGVAETPQEDETPEAEGGDDE